MTLTQEMLTLREAAEMAIKEPDAWPFYRSRFKRLATPELVLAILDQLESGAPAQTGTDTPLFALVKATCCEVMPMGCRQGRDCPLRADECKHK